LDDFKIVEALTLESPLLAGEGFYAPGPGIPAAHRDEGAIAAAWRMRGHELLELWVSGWSPGKWATNDGMPGKPGTRPKGWWKHAAPRKRRVGESVHRYLDSIDGWLPGERERVMAGVDDGDKSPAGA
jgi:hypothetical protein